MEDRVVSLETQIALLQKDIAELRTKSYELPAWFKKSAITVVGMLFLQLSSTIWWAAEITTNLTNLEKNVQSNSNFRMEFPKLHSESMVELQRIRSDQGHLSNMIKEVKNKLRYVDITTQHTDVSK